MLQLFPNSQALSMSSAKTIADILSYSQLIDTKASLGNPFTTQPIYIAACAFLKETAEQTATSKEHSRSQSTANSRAASPVREEPTPGIAEMANMTRPSSMLPNSTRPPMVERALARHTLLATAANQHYQLCYKALQSLETYWAGTKYILTVLDQKFKGVGDPLLYTAEEGESAFEQPEPKPAFTQPGWRKRNPSNPWSPSALMHNSFMQAKSPPAAGDPNQRKLWTSNVLVTKSDHLKTAIGWTLTGTLNSPSTNVAWHFTGGAGEPAQQSLDSLLDNNNPFAYSGIQNQPSAFQHPQNNHTRTYSGSSLPRPSPHQQRHHRSSLPASSFPNIAPSPNTFASPHDSLHLPPFNQSNNNLPTYDGGNNNAIEESYGDFLIESQDVDMSLLGLDMLPWFDAPSGDLMPVFDETLNIGDVDTGFQDDGHEKHDGREGE